MESELDRWIDNFITQIGPTNLSEIVRRQVYAHLHRLILDILHAHNAKSKVRFTVFRYGSVPLMTFLPDGDIDVGFVAYKKDRTIKQDGDCERFLEMLYNHFNSPEILHHPDFPMKKLRLVDAEVQVLKCSIRDIAVDISANKLGGCCSLIFLNAIDARVQRGHLFKRSILLIKCWCAYESRTLGSWNGLMATYALETLIINLFYLHFKEFSSPLQVLLKFLQYYAQFDWENHVVTACGPIPISNARELIQSFVASTQAKNALKATAYNSGRKARNEVGSSVAANSAITADFSIERLAAEMNPSEDGVVILECAEYFQKRFRFSYSSLNITSSKAGSSLPPHFRGFPFKSMNVIDPLHTLNNLGRSVSESSFYRIVAAFQKGCVCLTQILRDGSVPLLHEFFKGTFSRFSSLHHLLAFQTPALCYYVNRLGSLASETTKEEGDDSTEHKIDADSTTPFITPGIMEALPPSPCLSTSDAVSNLVNSSSPIQIDNGKALDTFEDEVTPTSVEEEGLLSSAACSCSSENDDFSHEKASLCSSPLSNGDNDEDDQTYTQKPIMQEKKHSHTPSSTNTFTSSKDLPSSSSLSCLNIFKENGTEVVSCDFEVEATGNRLGKINEISLPLHLPSNACIDAENCVPKKHTLEVFLRSEKKKKEEGEISKVFIRQNTSQNFGKTPTSMTNSMISDSSMYSNEKSFLAADAMVKSFPAAANAGENWDSDEVLKIAESTTAGLSGALQVSSEIVCKDMENTQSDGITPEAKSSQQGETCTKVNSSREDEEDFRPPISQYTLKSSDEEGESAVFKMESDPLELLVAQRPIPEKLIEKVAILTTELVADEDSSHHQEAKNARVCEKSNEVCCYQNISSQQLLHKKVEQQSVEAPQKRDNEVGTAPSDAALVPMDTSSCVAGTGGHTAALPTPCSVACAENSKDAHPHTTRLTSSCLPQSSDTTNESIPQFGEAGCSLPSRPAHKSSKVGSIATNEGKNTTDFTPPRSYPQLFHNEEVSADAQMQGNFCLSPTNSETNSAATPILYYPVSYSSSLYPDSSQSALPLPLHLSVAKPPNHQINSSSSSTLPPSGESILSTSAASCRSSVGVVDPLLWSGSLRPPTKDIGAVIPTEDAHLPVNLGSLNICGSSHSHPSPPVGAGSLSFRHYAAASSMTDSVSTHNWSIFSSAPSEVRSLLALCEILHLPCSTGWGAWNGGNIPRKELEAASKQLHLMEKNQTLDKGGIPRTFLHCPLRYPAGVVDGGYFPQQLHASHSPHTTYSTFRDYYSYSGRGNINVGSVSFNASHSNGGAGNSSNSTHNNSNGNYHNNNNNNHHLHQHHFQHHSSHNASDNSNANTTTTLGATTSSTTTSSKPHTSLIASTHTKSSGDNSLAAIGIAGNTALHSTSSSLNGFTNAACAVLVQSPASNTLHLPGHNFNNSGSSSASAISTLQRQGGPQTHKTHHLSHPQCNHHSSGSDCSSMSSQKHHINGHLQHQAINVSWNPDGLVLGGVSQFAAARQLGLAASQSLDTPLNNYLPHGDARQSTPMCRIHRGSPCLLPSQYGNNYVTAQRTASSSSCATLKGASTYRGAQEKLAAARVCPHSGGGSFHPSCLLAPNRGGGAMIMPSYVGNVAPPMADGLSFLDNMNYNVIYLTPKLLHNQQQDVIPVAGFNYDGAVAMSMGGVVSAFTPVVEGARNLLRPNVLSSFPATSVATNTLSSVGPRGQPNEYVADSSLLSGYSSSVKNTLSFHTTGGNTQLSAADTAGSFSESSITQRYVGTYASHPPPGVLKTSISMERLEYSPGQPPMAVTGRTKPEVCDKIFFENGKAVGDGSMANGACSPPALEVADVNSVIRNIENFQHHSQTHPSSDPNLKLDQYYSSHRFAQLFPHTYESLGRLGEKGGDEALGGSPSSIKEVNIIAYEDHIGKEWPSSKANCLLTADLWKLQNYSPENSKDLLPQDTSPEYKSKLHPPVTALSLSHADFPPSPKERQFEASSCLLSR